MDKNNDFPGLAVQIKASGRDGEMWEEYRSNGIRGPLHRVGGPALTFTSRNGIVVEEKFYKDGKLHRLDGPAVISRDPYNGAITVEEWYRDGSLHREDGPARVQRNPDG